MSIFMIFRTYEKQEIHLKHEKDSNKQTEKRAQAHCIRIGPLQLLFGMTARWASVFVVYSVHQHVCGIFFLNQSWTVRMKFQRGKFM